MAGRPPIGDRAQTPAERQKRYRDKKRREREAQPERKRAARRVVDRVRKRTERAAVKVASAATLPAVPAMPADLVTFAERLEVTQGDHAGDLLTVLPWQSAVLRVVEGMAGGEYGLSLPAGSGKTTLVAAIAAAALVWSPLVRPRADVMVVAGSFPQAGIAFDHAAHFLRAWTDADPDRWRVLRSESVALIEDRETGVKLRAREASARTLHGAAPAMVIADEPAQWQPTQRDAIYSALRSRLGKIPGSVLLAIGTRSDDAAHWFSRLLERNGITYAADADADPFLPATWHAANPSLAHFPSLRAVYQREADEARADPSLLPAFKALRLNLGTADHEIAVLIDVEAWQRCEVDILPAARGPSCWGIDLSGGDALAAIACYHPQCGRLECIAAFPELPSLAERGRTDGADYERMHADEDLLVLGRRVVPTSALVAAALERWGRPSRIVADHHQERELREALEAAHFPAAALVTSGMGWAHGPARIRDFRRAVSGGKVWARPTLLIRQSMSNARVVSDSMGAEKPIKGGASGRKRTARDDVAIAALLAVSEGARLPAAPRRRRHYVA